ncbi:hypothetical protein M2416_000076 [Raoultella sp. BIGb0132]|nr:hypothetical protein [Raoultella sp. BIGb0132]MCS4286586.1 hypothetical protein [Raoultella terrigena]
MKIVGELIVENQHNSLHATEEFTTLLSAIKLGANLSTGISIRPNSSVSLGQVDVDVETYKEKNNKNLICLPMKS